MNDRRTPFDLRVRTKAFALSVLRLVDDMPRTRSANVVGLQLLRSGTSLGANYRAARRARSRREFIAKMGIVEEEADESSFWLELIGEQGMAANDRVAALRREADELVAIVVASIRTARRARPSVPRSAFRAPRS
jgi:four helix bundle protein